MRNCFLALTVMLSSASLAAQTPTPPRPQGPTVTGAPSGELLPPGPGAASVLHITGAEMQDLIKTFPTQNYQVKSTNAGVHVVDVWVENRPKSQPAAAGRTPTDTVHSDMTEIYYILEGSGTLMTGARMIEARYRDDPKNPDGMFVPSFSGRSEGGTIRNVSVGDVVVVPPWVVHQWRTVDVPLKYLNIRIDPEHIQPPNYVNPKLKK